MKVQTSILFGALVLFATPMVGAHVSIVSGAAFANTSQIVTFGVGHGCAGADTFSVEVTIPPSVTSVRLLPSEFGRATFQTDSAGAVTSVTWQKELSAVLPADTGYYELRVRFRVPDAPFSTVYFPSRQTCRAANGTMTTTDWVGLPGMMGPDGGTLEPAPALVVLPARQPGWNRYTVARDVSDLATYFRDASIVWSGAAAYSINPSTATLITSTPGVTALTTIRASEQIWVRY